MSRSGTAGGMHIRCTPASGSRSSSSCRWCRWPSISSRTSRRVSAAQAASAPRPGLRPTGPVPSRKRPLAAQVKDTATARERVLMGIRLPKLQVPRRLAVLGLGVLVLALILHLGRTLSRGRVRGGSDRRPDRPRGRELALRRPVRRAGTARCRGRARVSGQASDRGGRRGAARGRGPTDPRPSRRAARLDPAKGHDRVEYGVTPPLSYASLSLLQRSEAQGKNLPRRDSSSAATSSSSSSPGGSKGRGLARRPRPVQPESGADPAPARHHALAGRIRAGPAARQRGESGHPGEPGRCQ